MTFYVKSANQRFILTFGTGNTPVMHDFVCLVRKIMFLFQYDALINSIFQRFIFSSFIYRSFKDLFFRALSISLSKLFCKRTVYARFSIFSKNNHVFISIWCTNKLYLSTIYFSKFYLSFFQRSISPCSICLSFITAFLNISLFASLPKNKKIIIFIF